MKKVSPKSAGVKLNGKWCFKGQNEIVSDEEYNANKEFVDVIEDIRENNERVIEIVVKDETIDLEELKKDIEEYVENYKKEEVKTDKNSNENVDETDNTSDNPDEELEALKERAAKLGIKVTSNMKKETVINKIEEKEAEEDKKQNPGGEPKDGTDTNDGANTEENPKGE